MRKERLQAARSVADCLFDFEKALDDALARGSALSSRIVGARMEAHVSAVLGQEAIEGAVRTLTLLASARRELVGTHHQLKHFADQIGLREVAWGDLVKPPAAEMKPAAPLRAVA